MQFSQLETVKHRLTVGQPLPFNVRNADHTLLLARGQVVGTTEQMEALFTRGALVDLAELRGPADAIKDAAPEQLPALWLGAERPERLSAFAARQRATKAERDDASREAATPDGGVATVRPWHSTVHPMIGTFGSGSRQGHDDIPCP